MCRPRGWRSSIAHGAREAAKETRAAQRGAERVSYAAAGLSRSHCACGVPQLGRSQVVSSCEQRSKSHRIHHEHHCIPIPYQFHDPFGSLSTTPMFHSHMCRPVRGTGKGPKREGQWLGPRAVSRDMRGAYSAVLAHQLAVLGLALAPLHLALATFPCSIPIFRPERHTEAGARTRGSARWPRAVSRARHMRGAHSPQVSRITACGVGTCIGTCIGKRNGERSARGRRAKGTARWWGVLRLPSDQAHRARWRGTSDDAPHVRLHRHSAPGDLSVSRLEPRRVERC